VLDNKPTTTAMRSVGGWESS